MYPAPFRYHRPGSLDSAITLLSELGEGARPLAGGQSLIPILKMRMDEPADLVDIGRLPELMHIRKEKDRVCIGALVTHARIAASGVADDIPIIRDCAGHIGDPQVRAPGNHRRISQYCRPQQRLAGPVAYPGCRDRLPGTCRKPQSRYQGFHYGLLHQQPG